MPNMRPLRRRIRWTRLIVLLFILITIVTSISWAAVYAYKRVSSVTALSTNANNSKLPEPVSKYNNILLLGVDDGDSEHPSAPKRSDTIIVASINVDDGKVSLLSIPRDTKVAIPGHKGSEKVAHAFYYGGSELAVRTVEDLLQIRIQHSIVIDWQAFIKTVDALGGVDLYVENNMHYEDPYANLVIDLVKGYQHLDGSQSGQYVRFRSDELGDIGRVQRQQRFLKVLAKQTLQVGNIWKIPSLIHTMDQYITTDITGFGMVKLANHIRKVKPEDLYTEMLPGNFATVDGISYWVQNKEQTAQLIERMLANDNSKVSGIFIP